MFGEETLRGQLVFAVVVHVHQTECLGQPGLQLRAVQQQLDTEKNSAQKASKTFSNLDAPQPPFSPSASAGTAALNALFLMSPVLW